MADRNLYHTAYFLILLSISACNSSSGKRGTTNEYTRNIQTERSLKDKKMLSDGIIEDKDLEGFRGLNYYDPDTSYRIQATMKMLPPLKVIFKTNTDRSPEYYTFCVLEFKLADSACFLIAYAREPDVSDGLFIPFKDLSNLKTTYGGGRYLEIPYQGEKEFLILDFNKAFNPYCHYNHTYSCPLVPVENKLNVFIRAGEKIFK